MEEVIQDTIINVNAKRSKRSINDSEEGEKEGKHLKLNEEGENDSDNSVTQDEIGNHKHNDDSSFETIPLQYDRTSRSIGMELDEKVHLLTPVTSLEEMNNL